MHAGETFDAVVDPNQANNQRSGGRAWNADKPAFINFADERVEQRQTQGGAGAVDKGDGITDFAKLPKLPFVGNQGRRYAEADHIGKAVELFAERALAVGQTGNASVHAVEQHGKENCNRRRFITSVHGLGNGEEGAKQCGDGKGIGQQVNAVFADGVAWRNRIFCILCVVHNVSVYAACADEALYRIGRLRIFKRQT